MITDDKVSYSWIKRLYQGFESSSGRTPEFTDFVRVVKFWFNKFIKETNCTKLDFHVGHFEFSGFFTAPDGQPWYFSSGDVRFLLMKSMLIRRVRDYKDYQGEFNQTVPYDTETFVEELKKVIGVQ